MRRRLVITVCPREAGTVRLPVTAGGRRLRLDAHAVLRELRALIAARDLAARVRVEEGCAGGCRRPGPNVTVDVFAATPVGRRPDHVAVGGRTYVYSMGTLACLADVIDQNLDPMTQDSVGSTG
jgi:hypothetical protein